MKEVRNLYGKLNSDDDSIFRFQTFKKEINSEKLGKIEYWYKEISLKVYEKDDFGRSCYVANVNLKYYLKPKKMLFVNNINVEEGFQELSNEKKSGVGGTIVRRLVQISDKHRVPIFLKNGINPIKQKNQAVLDIYKNKNFKTNPYMNDITYYSPFDLSVDQMDKYAYYLD